MDKTTKNLIIVLIIGLIIGGVGGYFSHNFLNRIFVSQRNFQQNFQPTDFQINEIKSFFDSNPSQDEINSYCQQNRMNCAYYCRNMNPDNTACSSMMNFSRRPMMGGNQ